jgi:hypothetical protein
MQSTVVNGHDQKLFYLAGGFKIVKPPSTVHQNTKAYGQNVWIYDFRMYPPQQRLKSQSSKRPDYSNFATQKSPIITNTVTDYSITNSIKKELACKVQSQLP